MEQRRDPLFVPGGMSSLLYRGSLAGALLAGSLLVWRLGSALASPRQQAPAEPVLERLFFPVEGANRARLRASFADPRAGRPQRGLDIFAPRHALVRAVDAGVVVRLSRSGAGGTAVEQVDGTGRYCYYYAHLDRYAAGLREGQTVDRGQVIGYVGTSGNAPRRSPHLHFGVFRSEVGAGFRADEVRGCWSGSAVDPYPLLTDRPTSGE